MIVDDELLDNDKMVIETSCTVSQLMMKKIYSRISPETNNRIVIVTNDDNKEYFNILSNFIDKCVVEYPTASAFKIWNNWIHVLTPKTFYMTSKNIFTDIYVADYTESYNNIVPFITVYTPDVLWVWGKELKDSNIQNLIKIGYQEYIKGTEFSVNFYKIDNKSESMKQVMESTTNRLWEITNG